MGPIIDNTRPLRARAARLIRLAQLTQSEALRRMYLDLAARCRDLAEEQEHHNLTHWAPGPCDGSSVEDNVSPGASTF